MMVRSAHRGTVKICVRISYPTWGPGEVITALTVLRVDSIVHMHRTRTGTG